MKRRSGIFKSFLVLTLLAVVIAAGWLFFTFRHKNIVIENGVVSYLLVPHGADFEQLMDSLTGN
ncbi:MAG: hypothetical protein WC262_05355, partial [Bacteroidales bacterium]